MTQNRSTRTKTRTGRTLVAAAVSAAIIGAVAISEPWSPANAAAGRRCRHDHDARRLRRPRKHGASRRGQRASHPFHPAHCPLAHGTANAGDGNPGALPALPTDARGCRTRHAAGRGRRLRVHHRRLGAHRHEPPRGEGSGHGDGHPSGRAQARSAGSRAPIRRPTSRFSRSTPVKRCRWSSSGIPTGRGSETGWSRSGTPSGSAAPSPRASSRRAGATSARVPMTTISSSMPRSTAATPAAPCSTAAGAWSA